MKTKKNRRRLPLTSNWVPMVMLGLTIASYIWTVSFKLARLEEKVDNLVEVVMSIKVNSDNVPLLKFRTDMLENRLDKLEPRMEAVEKKSKL